MHELEFTADGRRWRADLASPVDLAIPLDFAGPQPRFFAAGPASATPLRAGTFSGEVRTGASCNCSVHTLAPHCHGTHTESVGHVTLDGPDVAALTPVAPALAALITVQPASEHGPAGSALPAGRRAADYVITRELLAAAAEAWAAIRWPALVIRSLPNDPAKAHRAYSGPNPAPWFTAEAMHWIVARGVTSLVVDLPSLDRADDGGVLAAHRIFWGLAAGERESNRAQRGRALVTELAFVPDRAPDGLYLLDLQVAAFCADAAPSRPVLYSVAEVPR